MAFLHPIDRMCNTTYQFQPNRENAPKKWAPSITIIRKCAPIFVINEPCFYLDHYCCWCCCFFLHHIHMPDSRGPCLVNNLFGQWLLSVHVSRQTIGYLLSMGYRRRTSPLHTPRDRKDPSPLRVSREMARRICLGYVIRWLNADRTLIESTFWLCPQDGKLCANEAWNNQ